MRRIYGVLAFTAMSCGLAASAQAAVQVSFDNPDRYTDAETRRVASGPDLQPTLQGVEGQFKTLSDRYLGPDQVLKVEVLDIDLAGRYEPWRPFSPDVRVMRAVDWPRIKLRYSLENKAGVLASGDETLRDMDYLRHVNVNYAADPLRYEKAMISKWFLTRLGRFLPPGPSKVSFQPGN
jgi:hypothetical protein